MLPFLLLSSSPPCFLVLHLHHASEQLLLPTKQHCVLAQFHSICTHMEVQDNYYNNYVIVYMCCCYIYYSAYAYLCSSCFVSWMLDWSILLIDVTIDRGSASSAAMVMNDALSTVITCHCMYLHHGHPLYCS